MRAVKSSRQKVQRQTRCKTNIRPKVNYLTAKHLNLIKLNNFVLLQSSSGGPVIFQFSNDNFTNQTIFFFNLKYKNDSWKRMTCYLWH